MHEDIINSDNWNNIRLNFEVDAPVEIMFTSQFIFYNRIVYLP